ncbi:MAG: hypothetical protein DHS20C18_46470 [Saprospiraceae bacterium]|nr:MAG: hypothetical protein DHS20C18_46470 [Saprospiraceae bacterium]
MPTIHQVPGRAILIKGEEWLHFSGTSYLGVAALPAFRQLVMTGLEQYGTNFGGSRLSNIQFDIYEEAELLLAKISGAPAALTVSSGTLAAQWAMQALAPKMPFHYAPQTHPAMVVADEASNGDRSVWELRMLELAHQGRTPAAFVSNGIDALQLDPYDFGWLFQLPKDIPYTLVIDDSHVFGVLGRQGGGSYRMLNIPENVNLIVVGSMGKAWGIPGGVILGAPSFIESLKQSKQFGGASPVIPAYLHAFVQAQALYLNQQDQLKRNIDLFQGQLGPMHSFISIPEFPVFASQQHHIVAQLAKHRIMISSFPYPSPESELITRIVLNASHSAADIEQLVKVLSMEV